MIPKQTPHFDERRNTSRTFAVSPNALPDALRALARLRVTDPDLVRWIEEGHPTLTAAEHFERFGAEHEGKRARRAA